MEKYSEHRPTGFDRQGAFLDERQDWLVLPVSQNRDSGPLDQSNFEQALEMLGGERNNIIEVHRFGHWAWGWYEIIIVNPKAGKTLKIAESIESSLEDYPVLNEQDFSDKEMELIEECWTSYGRSDFEEELTSHIEYLIGEGKLQNSGNLIDEYGEVDLMDYDKEIDEIADMIFNRLPYGPEIETGGSVYFDYDMMLNEIDITDLWIFTNEHCMIDVHQLKLFGPKWINPSELVQ